MHVQSPVAWKRGVEDERGMPRCFPGLKRVSSIGETDEKKKFSGREERERKKEKQEVREKGRAREVKGAERIG